MLYYLVSTIYVLVCFLLLIVVLLQQGKGGDMASAFGGGGSQTAFGARQGATVLSKATAVLGGLFMIGAILLAYLGNTSGSLLSGVGAPGRPAQAPASPVVPTPAPGTPAGAPPAPAPASATPAANPSTTPAPAPAPVEKPKQ